MSRLTPQLLPALLLPLALLGGCRSVETRPEPPAPDASALFSIEVEGTASDADVVWWKSDLPATHREWIDRLFATNPAIHIAAGELRQQRAALQAADAARGPNLDATAGGRVNRNDGDGSERIEAGLDARLPLDVSGQLDAGYQARLWDYRRARQQLHQVRQEQLQELLLALVDYAEARQLERLLEQQVSTTRKQLHLTEIRFTQGLVSSVDVLQQRDQIASLQQQFPDVALDARIAMNRISGLVGETPAMTLVLPDALVELQPALPLQRPIELLQRHPGLRAQQAALAATDADFEAALRARLPQMALSGSALWQLLAGNPSAVVQAALDASLNLVDSGARSAEIARQRALLEIAGTRYLQDWLAAVREADDLLNTSDALARQLRRNRERLEIAQQLHQATLSRYQRGVTDYLPVLTALRDLQAQERDALRLQAEKARTLTRLKIAAGLPPAVLDPMAREAE